MNYCVSAQRLNATHDRVAAMMCRSSRADDLRLYESPNSEQAERGYWPQITIGRRVFINVEAVRIHAAAQFTL